MFLELLKLIGRKEYSSNIPLEDFTTECFAGILKLNPDIFNAYIAYHELPEDEYKIETQFWRQLPNDQPNCYIDLVFIGNDNICFVENKVESKEGFEQLSRYYDVLHTYFKSYNKYLHYCTKYPETKNIKNIVENSSIGIIETNKFHYKSYKWYDIANFLKQFKKNYSVINDFFNFLEHYKMVQDNTIRIENLLSMQNMNKTIQIIETHLENSKGEFENYFGIKTTYQNSNWNEIKSFERFCNKSESIIDGEGYSEILYSIQLNDLTLSTHIYVNSKHEKFGEFDKIKIIEPLKKHETEHGTSIYMIDNLTKYLNKENSDRTIKEWYLNSFETMKRLMINNPNLKWAHNFK